MATTAPPLLRPVRALLLSVVLLMLGNGPLTTLISLRLNGAGASPALTGLVATAYFLGLTIGAMQAFRVILRVGHIRAFAVFASTVSATGLVYALWQNAALWALVRLVDGFCMAGLFICIESWLNDRAEPSRRGALLAAYMVCVYGAQAAGQGLLNIGGAGDPRPFLLLSILMGLSVLPVSMTSKSPTALPDVASLSLRQLYRISPLGMVGTVTSGLLLGAVYALAPLFARGNGLDLAGTTLFMTALILGGMDMWGAGLTGRNILGGWKHGKTDAEATGKAAKFKPIDYPKPDGKLSFDRLTNVAFSFTNHEESQPCHLKLKDPTIPIRVNLPEYAEPAQRYCPAGVYEVVEDANGPRFVINFQNCVHCKTCDIKDPSQNIVWTTPQGGDGPNYPNM